MDPAGRGDKPRSRAASFVAALAFTYALTATVVVLAATGLFEDDESRRRVLAWMTVPIVTTFVTWLAVRAAEPVMRLLVWVMILAMLFFCWIAIFSVGLYFLPAALLMIAAVLSPWRGESHDSER